MKRLILIALIISVSAGIVFAQVDVPGNAFTSPQSTATSGRLRSSADNFIRADAYSGLKFDKFYAMMGYQNAPNQANLGFATKAGDLYIGAYYGGTFWANTPQNSYTESYTTWKGDNKDGVKVYSALPATSNTAPSNNLSVLIGVADMGFRLSLYTNKQYVSDKDFVVGTTPYESYVKESGEVTPQLLWSMAKSLTSNGIQPYAAVNLAFARNRTASSTYVQNGTSWESTGESLTGDTNNSTLATIYAGLGGYTLLNKNGFKLSADIDYVLGIRGYDNEYNYTDNGSTKIKTGFKGVNQDTYITTATGALTSSTSTSPITTISNDYTELSITSHTITPSLSGQWSGGPLTFRFKLNLGVPIAEIKATENSIVAGSNDGSLEKNGTDKKITSVSFNPDLRLAAQWKIVPKLTLNLGGRINFTQLTTTTEEGKKYVNGDVQDNSSYKTVSNTVGSFSNTLAMGVTINPTDNLTFEVASGASNGTVNVFGAANGTNGLFYFTNLLVSLRY